MEGGSPAECGSRLVGRHWATDKWHDMQLTRFSLGLGDRFGWEGAAQLRAVQLALEKGVLITPVWNKSNREHMLIGTKPDDTRRDADATVRAAAWTGPYLVDADHITFETVNPFIGPSDYFTIDLAESLGHPTDTARAEAFLKEMAPFKGDLEIDGTSEPVNVTDGLLRAVAARYLSAVEEAGRVYRRIESMKGKGNFVTEVSLDEVAEPQTAAELLLVLGALAREGVPVQTIAPKFSGEFLKGVEYVGEPRGFAQEFAADIGVIDFARRAFALPQDLKLSIHSGSDKFSLYPLIRKAANATGAGFHLKTAGTTWLEEVIGIATTGGPGLRTAKDIYAAAYERFDELTAPYRTVVAIDRDRLPRPRDVEAWDSRTFVRTLEHEKSHDEFNPHFRQLVHVAFKVAAEMGPRFTSLVKEHRSVIERHVTDNIYRRHVTPLFLDGTVRPQSQATTARTDHGN